MVKVNSTTYRALIECLKEMERKGQAVPDFTFILERGEAVDFFSKLLEKGLNNEVTFELQKEENINNNNSLKAVENKELLRDEKKEVTRIGRTQIKVIEVLKTDGPTTAKQLGEKLGKTRSSINSACVQLVKKGIIKRAKRGLYEFVDTVSSVEVSEVKSSNGQGEEQEELKCKSTICNGLFSNERYSDIVEYIFTKSSFFVEKLRDSFLLQSDEIVEVIKIALEEGCIVEVSDRTGKYIVDDCYRLFYWLLKMDRVVPYQKILAEFSGVTPNTLRQLLKTCEERKIVRVTRVNSIFCYEAV